MPKTWGNTRSRHRTAILATSLVSACHPGARVDERAVRAHWIPGCAASPSAPPAKVTVDALGDFDPSPSTHVENLVESGSGVALPLPQTTRAIVADVTVNDRADDGGAPRQSEFTGVGRLDTSNDIDVSLWPTASTCGLGTGDREAGVAVSGSTATQAFGVAPESGLVLVTGPRRSNEVGALVLNVATATVEAVPDDVGPRTRRAGGTVTAFGQKLLVAGGRDAETRAPLASADVFDPATRAFDVATIALDGPRAAHAAAVLASGETLLVGGVDSDGNPLRTLASISPDTGAYRVSGLPDLEVARANSHAFRLSDDRVLVAGGTDGTGTCTLSPTADPSGNCTPVELLEWVAADASRIDQESTALVDSNGGPPTSGRAFVPMPGGSVLAVGGCNLRTPSPEEQPGCMRFCPNGGCPSTDVIWISREGTPTSLPNALDVVAARPVLTPGEDGRPWLIGDLADGRRALRRFDPWLGKFVCPDSASAGASCGSDTTLTLPMDPGAQALAPDPGLVVWLGDESGAASLRAFRHGTRGAYSDAGNPLTGGSTGLSLDRAQGLDARLVPQMGDAPRAADGGFTTLPNGDVELVAPGATLAVTDRTYADVRVAIDVDDGPPPDVNLGDHLYGETACPWPIPTPNAPYTAVLVRRGGSVELSFSGTATPKLQETCDGPVGRVAVSLVGPGPIVRVASVTLDRTLP